MVKMTEAESQNPKITGFEFLASFFWFL